MIGMARAQDIMPGTLGDLYGSVAREDGTTTTLRYALEAVLTMDLLTAYGSVVERDRLAFAQDDLDTVALG
jgi:hypothetical protein